MKKSDQIGTLLFRYVRNELSHAEKDALMAWRRVSSDNERLFREKTDPEHILSQLGTDLETRDRIFQKIKERYSGPWEQPSVGASLRLDRVLRIAAVFILVLGAVLFFLLQGSKKADGIQPGSYQAVLVSPDGISEALNDFRRGFLLGSAGIKIEKRLNGELLFIAQNDPLAGKDRYFKLSTPRGGQFGLKLPDGTMVWLNAQSSIKYPANFSQDFVGVTVEGEVYFEISNHARSNLRIFAGPMQTEGPGAQLNIISYPDEPVGITLVQGNADVRLAPGVLGTSPTVVALRPSDQAGLANGTRGMAQRLTIIPVKSPQDIIAWKNGQTSYHQVKIETIMQAVSRWYATDIIYRGEIPDKKYNLILPRRTSLYRLLSELAKQGGHFVVQGTTITVTK